MQAERSFRKGDAVLVTSENLEAMENAPVHDATSERPVERYLEQIRRLVDGQVRGYVEQIYPEVNLLLVFFDDTPFSIRMDWVTPAPKHPY